jgi:hypothetical protein
MTLTTRRTVQFGTCQLVELERQRICKGKEGSRLADGGKWQKVAKGAAARMEHVSPRLSLRNMCLLGGLRKVQI